MGEDRRGVHSEIGESMGRVLKLGGGNLRIFETWRGYFGNSEFWGAFVFRLGRRGLDGESFRISSFENWGGVMWAV